MVRKEAFLGIFALKKVHRTQLRKIAHWGTEPGATDTLGVIFFKLCLHHQLGLGYSLDFINDFGCND